ncbi:MAG TPA: AMP-binding protein, partial [Candidatus Eremiobacteraceae bacterium]|nr:AMP-binding protein [Candidatus Eremiobacteraceae bacterium]
MFIDPSADARVIERCCAMQPPAAFFGSAPAQLLRVRFPALRVISRRFSGGAPLFGSVSLRSAERLAPYRNTAAVQPDAPALLTFTSGSTGMPKAAVRSHALLRSQLQRLRETLSFTPGDVDLTTLPIVLLANLACGVTSVISSVDLRRPGDVNGARVFADAQHRRVTSATASPAFFERLADFCEQSNARLPLVQKVFCGGAPVFPRTMERIARVFPNARVSAVYGSTEAEPIADFALDELSAADREQMASGAGLIGGRPVYGIRVAVIREQWGTPLGPLTTPEFARLAQPRGKQGEILVAGDHVIRGYLHGRGDEETKVNVDGTVWHRTGDSGYLDELGRIWLLGRCDAKIDDAKGTLYPFAVECAASECAAVHRSALIRGAARRVLVVEPPLNSDQLAELQATIGWAGLDEVRFVKHIPVDRKHNAKVDYPALRRRLKT